MYNLDYSESEVGYLDTTHSEFVILLLLRRLGGRDESLSYRSPVVRIEMYIVWQVWVLLQSLSLHIYP